MLLAFSNGDKHVQLSSNAKIINLATNKKYVPPPVQYEQCTQEACMLYMCVQLKDPQKLTLNSYTEGHGSVTIIWHNLFKASRENGNPLRTETKTTKHQNHLLRTVSSKEESI